jgi:hypothetical protein
MIKVAKGLYDLGYMEDAVGFYDRKSKKGFKSRMKATQKLIDVIEKKNAVTFEMIGKYVPDELIVMRNADGVDIDYVDTSDIDNMRTLLETYNDLLSKTYIYIHFEVADIQDRIDKCRAKKYKVTGLPRDYRLVVNLSNKRVRRIFNKSTFNKGGRFYGGWWQNIPSVLREKIIINTHYTVEIDYSGLHIYMLYALKGINFSSLDKEPYIYPKDNDPNNLRQVLKVLLLAAINSKDEEECIKAVRYEINMNKDAFPEELPDLKEAYNQFKEHHPDIADMFCSKSGLKLQRWDSDIAEAVVKVMTKENIPVLVIHDSFIVPKPDADFLYEIMIKAYEYHTLKLINNNNLPIKECTTPIDTKAKDITLKQYELMREEDILTKSMSLIDTPFGRRFFRYMSTENTTTDVVIKVFNNTITEAGYDLNYPTFEDDNKDVGQDTIIINL